MANEQSKIISSSEAEQASVRDLYLDLLKKTLVNWIYCAEERPRRKIREYNFQKLLKRKFRDLPWGAVFKKLTGRIRTIGVRRPETAAGEVHLQKLADGADYSPAAHTMIGLKRLSNLQFCIEQVLLNNIPGDMIETGVWRGGACIFMRGVLQAYNVTDRLVWVADSFEGLPPPDPEKYPDDRCDIHEVYTHMTVSLEQVQENFRKYNLLDNQVRFLKGWFRDTLPNAPITQLAVLRLDGDMYESTFEGLTHLYPKVSKGGYIIVDDYGALEGCRKAVHDFLDQYGIDAEIQKIDWTGIYWQKR